MWNRKIFTMESFKCFYHKNICGSCCCSFNKCETENIFKMESFKCFHRKHICGSCCCNFNKCETEKYLKWNPLNVSIPKTFRKISQRSEEYFIANIVDIGNWLKMFPRISIINIIYLSTYYFPHQISSSRSGNNMTYATDGHVINLQIEVFGCDNYVMDEIKIWFFKLFQF